MASSLSHFDLALKQLEETFKDNNENKLREERGKRREEEGGGKPTSSLAGDPFVHQRYAAEVLSWRVAHPFPLY